MSICLHVYIYILCIYSTTYLTSWHFPPEFPPKTLQDEDIKALGTSVLCMSVNRGLCLDGVFHVNKSAGARWLGGMRDFTPPRNWTQIPQNDAMEMKGDDIFPSDSFLVSMLDFGDVPFVHMFQSVFGRFIPSIPYMHQSGNSRRVYFRDKQKSHCF